ncbi:hypothetical protein EYC98_08660 [Halieaceae bacterium IMCC14734]|uniref:Uncharacterized protein n=1 Tax=Candidatus Litorirhabdus singularis TaxID=2518993 RepID=A0ABT3TFB0_9GAMM|nr:hypothetical protein [Candidatus Litorirhabdus singularis]MCX2980934.1 hypothetical protein [Candidatus Litorirhabdus singularis]
MSWLADAADRQQVLAAMPELAASYTQLYAQLWTLPQLPASSLELCRLRLAQLHNSAVEWQKSEAELAPGQRLALVDWPSSELFDSAERACLDFCEVYAMDTQAITDAQAEAVKQHHGDAGLVALVEALGLFDGMTRLSLLWQLPVLPVEGQ